MPPLVQPDGHRVEPGEVVAKQARLRGNPGARGVGPDPVDVLAAEVQPGEASSPIVAQGAIPGSYPEIALCRDPEVRDAVVGEDLRRGAVEDPEARPVVAHQPILRADSQVAVRRLDEIREQVRRQPVVGREDLMGKTGRGGLGV